MTFWAGTDSSGSPFVFELQPSGKFRYIPATGIVSKGNWKQNGNSIEMEVNGKFVKFSGVVESEQMKGEASSKRGLKWTWAAAKQPLVISNVAPPYPPIARAARVIGNVIVEVNIDAEGNVTSPHVTSGHPLLQQSAADAARRWKFATIKEPGKVRTARIFFYFRGEVVVKNKNQEVVAPIFLSPYQAEIRFIPLTLDYSMTYTTAK